MSTLDEKWLKMFKELKAFYEKKDIFAVPHEPLYTWLWNQRSRRKDLKPWKKECLESIDFVWTMTKRDKKWRKDFKKLEAFCGKMDIRAVPHQPLYTWLRNQRRRRKKEKRSQAVEKETP